MTWDFYRTTIKVVYLKQREKFTRFYKKTVYKKPSIDASKNLEYFGSIKMFYLFGIRNFLNEEYKDLNLGKKGVFFHFFQCFIVYFLFYFVSFCSCLQFSIYYFTSNYHIRPSCV